jgi:hypothetical protein
MHRCDRNPRKDGATALECAPTDKRTVTRTLTPSINVILRTHHSIWRATTALDVLLRSPGHVPSREPKTNRSGTEPRSHVATADPEQGSHWLEHAILPENWAILFSPLLVTPGLLKRRLRSQAEQTGKFPENFRNRWNRKRPRDVGSSGRRPLSESFLIYVVSLS